MEVFFHLCVFISVLNAFQVLSRKVQSKEEINVIATEVTQQSKFVHEM